MNPKIIQELLRAAGNNPTAVLDVLQRVLDFLKANPTLLAALLEAYAPKAK